MSEYRHEYKYFVPVQKMLCIEQRIKPLMHHDLNADSEGIYTIRSLYFDDYENSCYYENENGTDPREKFRLRIYNSDKSLVKLELKQKHSGKTKKMSCNVPYELCGELINGNIPDISAIDSPVYRKFCMQRMTRLLKPKVIVEYDRRPYVYTDGNVRVTFDLNIRSSNDIRDFFERQIKSRPVMPTNMHIFEVKFDEFLPDFLHQAVEVEKLRQETFSKYYICRKLNMAAVNL